MEQGKYKCPSCGGEMSFNIEAQMLKCDFCGATKEIEEIKEAVIELDFQQYVDNFENNAETIEVKQALCRNCGGEITFDPDAINLNCIYCGSKIVSDDKPHKVMKPGYLLPFKIERDRALTIFREWIKKIWFAPSALKKQAMLTEPLRGVYFPYWTFDAITDSTYRGMRGIHRQETYTETDSQGKTQTRTRTVTDWYPVSGKVHVTFDDILIPAGHMLDKELTGELKQWDLNNLSPFEVSYTSGFHAETYTIPLREGYKDAQSEMELEIKRSIRNDIGGDEQRIQTVQTDFDNITFKYILLPIWALVYKFQNKYYKVLINGRSGELKGKRPFSALKIISFIMVALFILWIIYMLISK